MAGFSLYIGTACALMLVIEGLVYALFPETVRKMMALALALPVSRLRFIGLAALTAGAAIIWLLHIGLG